MIVKIWTTKFTWASRRRSQALNKMEIQSLALSNYYESPRSQYGVGTHVIIADHLEAYMAHTPPFSGLTISYYI